MSMAFELSINVANEPPKAACERACATPCVDGLEEGEKGAGS